MTAIETIKSAIYVNEYAARFLTVRNGTALCPWHREKTPSLKLYAAYFKCHGCGVGGDILAFASAYHGISTGAAIRLLADEAGITLERQPAAHPYDAAKAARLRAEAQEWHRQARAALVAARNSDDWDRVAPFLARLDAWSRHAIMDAYTGQRTPEQAAMLRASIREADVWVKAMTPIVERLIAS